MTSIQSLAGRSATALGRAAAGLAAVAIVAIDRFDPVVEPVLEVGLGVALLSITLLYLWLALETVRIVRYDAERSRGA